MDLVKKVIGYTITEIDKADLVELRIKLALALQIIEGLSSWDAEKVLNIMFGGEQVAE